ncbi:hypothetical protein OH76DRAFT_152647 [Lentinus brumalis]|uniref:Uncharacterized protein n=1 Tax=Lentinus brumalis TaxID=2498619 RepID=A0A371CNR6_9APHY|nr:hypothetical protein OH76DRAFT_152647 [Polyporus brumalis]
MSAITCVPDAHHTRTARRHPAEAASQTVWRRARCGCPCCVHCPADDRGMLHSPTAHPVLRLSSSRHVGRIMSLESRLIHPSYFELTNGGMALHPSIAV